MRFDRRFIGWGVFFIVVGAIPLLVQQGVISSELTRRALSLWPLFLVAIGLGLLLQNTALDWLGGLVAATTAAVMAGSFLAGGVAFPAGFCSGTATGDVQEVASGSFAADARVRVDLPCGVLTVTTAEGPAWTISARTGNGRIPDVSAGDDSLAVSGGRGGGFFIDAIDAGADWTVTLPTERAMDLDVSIDAGSGTLDLAGGRFDELTVDVNAGAVHVDAAAVATLRQVRVGVNAGDARVALPNTALDVRMEANAGSLAFCVPPGTEVRLHLDDNITVSNNLAAEGLVRSGDTWETPGADTAAEVITMRIEANAASVTMNPEDGC